MNSDISSNLNNDNMNLYQRLLMWSILILLATSTFVIYFFIIECLVGSSNF